MHNGINAYQKANRVVNQDRLVQARFLRTIAEQLSGLVAQWDLDQVDTVVTANLRFWTVVQADAIDENCPLPAPLRKNLLKLSSVVDRRTLEIIENPTPDKLDLLISINISCAEGLEM